ncbi:hypothetical protein FZEAL_1131 [Fusarium zealandicum]|uniref:Zn(2)-C6 fungal-type domain-containing protein n=1 Tax=Fusarium zealandicum TaxID=1053134 RepID=A0A8H4UU30_9HYPO|nr:hypothetical protein FZEAL_1131 [Fusarium zealandicum]
MSCSQASEDLEKQDSGPIAPLNQLACRQCRARKVKCDRRSSGCMRCERLDLACSYTSPDSTGLPSVGRGQDLTQAGIKRRRIIRACAACRLSKSKCSGTHPCDRCRAHSQECLFGDDGGTAQSNATVEAFVSPVSPPPTDHGSVPSQYTPIDMSSVPDNDSLRVFENESRDAIRQYIDTYFDKSDFADCIFLHRATIIAEWSQAKLDKSLLKAICAAGLRTMSSYHGEGSTTYEWMKQVQHDLVNQMGDMSIPKLQALMLVVKFLSFQRFTGDVWVLVSIAARVAFTKRLNYERPALDPVKQECLRRLMWSIYLTDKIFSGGIEDLTVCPTQRMHVRLPSSHHNFQLGLKSRSQFLRSSSEDETDLNALAYFMRLYDIRDRVLRYTRRVILGGSSPFLSRGQLHSLDLELTSFEESLPEELQLNESRIMLMCHSEEARTYATLHTILFSCRCDLHRFLIPGIKESVSPEAANQTPQEYINYCQRRCLQSALGYCDFWSKVRRLETSSRIESTTLAVVTYQSVKIVDHLAALLPPNGEHSLQVVKQKLADALFIASRSQTRFDCVVSCIADIEKLIPLLGTRARSTESPSPQRTFRTQEKLHRRSKHVFAPDDEEEIDPAVNISESFEADVVPVEDTSSSTPINAFGQGNWPFSLPSDSQDMLEPNQTVPINSDHSFGYDLMHYDLSNSADVAFGEHEMAFPMDPFNLQLNAYTDIPHYLAE